MGCCFSGDVIPDAPKELRTDPDFMTPQEFAVKALGMFGTSRDFGVWEKEYPDNSNDRREKMWLWYSILQAFEFFCVNIFNFILFFVVKISILICDNVPGLTSLLMVRTKAVLNSKTSSADISPTIQRRERSFTTLTLPSVLTLSAFNALLPLALSDFSGSTQTTILPRKTHTT